MQTQPLQYVALGDSIATGCLTYWEATDGYPIYLSRRLRAHRPVVLRNYAINGDTTDRLLWRLNHWQALRRAVAAAGLLTLSIGGNDLLRAAAVPGFTSIHPGAARYGMERFLENYPRIIAAIRTLNSTAPLVVMTIYNPYCSSANLGGALCDRGLHELTERHLTPMNSTILDASHQNYAVADVHTAFLRYRMGCMGQVVALYPRGSFLLRNPHPTPWGHRIIAQLHDQALGGTP